MPTPAGWYDDGTGAMRWWDGERWTEHTSPAAAAQAVSVPTAPAAPVAVPTGAAPGYSGFAPTYPTIAPAYPGAAVAPRWNVLAIVSSFLWLVGFGLVGLVLGIVGLVQINRNPPQRGKELAIVGIVLGGLATLIVPIVAAIAVPVFLSTLDSSKDVAVRTFLSDVEGQLESVHDEDGEYPVSLGLDPGPLNGVDIRVGYTSPTPDDYCLEAKYGADGHSYHVLNDGDVETGTCDVDGYSAEPQN